MSPGRRLLQDIAFLAVIAAILALVAWVAGGEPF